MDRDQFDVTSTKITCCSLILELAETALAKSDDAYVNAVLRAVR